MNCNSILSTYILIFMCITGSSFAQQSFTYKLIFSGDISSKSEPLRTLLNAYSDFKTIDFHTSDNSVIINSSKSLNKTILLGKLEKMNVSLASFENVKNLSVTDDKQEKETQVHNSQKLADKNAKRNVQFLERQKKPVSNVKNKRY